MDNIKNIIVGSVITLVVGGTAYTFSQQDVVDNFAEDTGMTQEESKEYVDSVSADDLVPYDEVGQEFIASSEESLALAADIDCQMYEYEWETPTLSCVAGKEQLEQIAVTERALGNAFIQVGTPTATNADIQTTISYLDQINSDYQLEIVQALFDGPNMEENMKTNSYNKALLKAALESQQ
jgi:hypothetical protein